MTVIFLPAGVIDVIRKGLTNQIEWAAETIRDANERFDAPEHRERLRQALHQSDARWALLGTLGRATPPVDHCIDLDVHGWALITAVITRIPVQADLIAEIDQNDARRVQNREQPRRAALLKEAGALCQVALAILQSRLEVGPAPGVGSTSTASLLELEPHDPVSLTDNEAVRFIEAFEQIASVKRAYRDTRTGRHAADLRRYSDSQFEGGLKARRRRRLERAADELFWSIEAFSNLVGTEEHALDELLNCTFNETMEAPDRPDVDSGRLAAGRARLRNAGLEWAKVVVHVAATNHKPPLARGGHQQLSSCEKL